MSALKNAQHEFTQAVFKDTTLDFVSSPHPHERFNVYRQTILETLRNSLSLNFPGIWTLLGQDCADSVAYAFCREQNSLPTTGCLDDWGDAFPEFLSRVPELQDLPYLKDYASYEWLQHLAYIAADADPIQTDTLAQVPEHQVDTTRLAFLPSVFLYTSIYPIHKIQEVVKNPDADAITLNNTNVYALIARPANKVITLWIHEDSWLFFQALQKGLSLSQAAEHIALTHAEFDLTQAIYFLLTHHLIHTIAVPGDDHDS